MTTPDLTSYKAIESGLFVRLTVGEYRQVSGDSPTSTVLRFSDYARTVTVNGESYQGIGRLLGITASRSELRTSSDTITVSLSGIPNTSLTEIINSKIKGSRIEVRRVLFNPTTGAQLSIAGNPVGRFFGVVNNYSLDETYDYSTRSSTNTVSLVCNSQVSVLGNKVTGRRTNPRDQKSFYPNDLSMDRVPNLAGANFNFGAPI
jgi:hypothetical protein